MRLNRNLRKLDTWLQGNKLSLNVAKTHSMRISTTQKHSILKGQNEDYKLKIRENELEVVNKANFLGLQIDYFLDWKEQIEAFSAKVSRAVEFLDILSLFFGRKLCKLSIQVLWSPNFDMAVLYEAALVQRESVSYRIFNCCWDDNEWQLRWPKQTSHLKC